MTKTKNVLLSALMLMVAVLLIACGNSNQSKDEKDALEQIKDNGVLNLGTSPDYPPLEFYILDENGDRQIVGSDITLAKAIAEEIGVELKITTTDFNGVLANVQSGSVDLGLAGFTFTEARAEVMQFSEGYLQESELGFQGIMVTKETAAKYDNLDDLKAENLVLGAQAGSIQYELANGLTEAANIKQYGTLDVGLSALNGGDIDGMVVSTSSAEPMLATFSNLVILPQDSFDLDPERLYSTNSAAIPMGDHYDSLLELVNKVIIENKENGNIEKWHAEAIELSRDAIEVEE